MTKSLKLLIKSLKTLPGFKQAYPISYYKSVGVRELQIETDIFRFRIYESKEKQEISIDIAPVKNFDRWANSTMFKTTRTTALGCFFPDILSQIEWAAKVYKNKLFRDYDYTIELPWINYERL